MNDIIKSIRQNKLYDWAFALGLAFIYRYGFGMFKDLIWANRKLDFITEIVDPNLKTQLFFLTAGVNFIVNVSSHLLPALVCSAILVYLLQKKAMLFSSAALVSFLTFNSRFWHFWEAPSIGMQISVVTMPLLGVIMLFLVTWATLKIKNAEQPNQPDTE